MFVFGDVDLRTLLTSKCLTSVRCFTEWPPIGKIAAHSAYDMFSWYKYLFVNLVFSHLGFWSGNLFLIAPFSDLCLLVLFHMAIPQCDCPYALVCSSVGVSDRSDMLFLSGK